MKYTKTLLTVTLLGLTAANTASAEWFKEFGDQARATEDTRLVDAGQAYAQSRIVTTDAVYEDQRGLYEPEQPGRDVFGDLPGR